MSDPHDVARELDRRIQELQQLPDASVRDLVVESLQLIDRLHRPGIQVITEALRGSGHLDDLCRDERVALLFELYAPPSEEDLVKDALDSVRPYIESHGGKLEFLNVTDGVVTLRLAGACQSCVASPATLTQGVETALKEGYAGFREMVVAAPDPDVPARAEDSDMAPGFSPVRSRDELPEARLVSVQAGEQSVLIVRVGDEVYAFAPACPSCDHPLSTAKVSGFVLVCSGINCAFDLRTGRRVDGVEGPGLRSVPTMWQGDVLLVADTVDPQSLFSTS